MKRGRLIIISLIVLLTFIGVVVAVAPNPGHSFSEIEKCSSNGQILKIVNGVWACSTDETGGTGSSPWTTSGNNIYYNNGNVGIGTTNPDQKLHVKSTSGSVNIQAEGQNGGSIFLGYHNSNDYGVIWQKNNLGNNFYDVITLKNGNVGIGTTNPIIKLTINLDNVAGSVGRDFLRVEGGNSDNSRHIVINKPLFSVWSTSKNTFADFEASNITAHGNVGIGTTNPDQKLHVSGGNVRFDGLVYIGGGSHTLNLWDENDDHGRLSYGNVYAWLGKDNVWFNLGGTGGQYFYIRDSNSNTKHWFNSNGEAYFSSKVGIGTTTTPEIRLAIGDADSGLDAPSGSPPGSIYIKTNGKDRIKVYGDDSGIRFYNNYNNELMNIGNVGIRVTGNLIVDDQNYFKFPMRSTPPFDCNGPNDAGAAYVRTQSPEVLCVCQGNGNEWAWFGNARGGEIRCAN